MKVAEYVILRGTVVLKYQDEGGSTRHKELYPKTRHPKGSKTYEMIENWADPRQIGTLAEADQYKRVKIVAIPESAPVDDKQPVSAQDQEVPASGSDLSESSDDPKSKPKRVSKVKDAE